MTHDRERMLRRLREMLTKSEREKLERALAWLELHGFVPLGTADNEEPERAS
jgi:hypothetical protein